MKIQRVRLQHFRSVRKGTVHLDGNTLLVGGTGVGKSTLCEALDLVLGPERMQRRPVVDEHDFHESRYLPTGQEPPPQIRIEVVLTDLSEAARRRFRDRLRPWSPKNRSFDELSAPDAAVSEGQGGAGGAPPGAQPSDGSGEQVHWCLPVVFLGRFDPEEEDFLGDTFFDHPIPDPEQSDPDELGEGRRPFRRADKRLCGFLYLRANRTGARALSFQRGSLLDTILRLESERTGLIWEQALRAVESVEVSGSPASSPTDGAIDDLIDDSALASGTSSASDATASASGRPAGPRSGGFAPVRTAVRDRIARFVSLSAGQDALDVQVSDLTRENLREVLRLVVSTQPGAHAVPVSRLSTGTLNQLVFALLTYIAELQGQQSVIFAMEEPEIALPPHAQRRLVDFATATMGQSIVTSHSPYVIGRFDPHQIVPLHRHGDGTLEGSAIQIPPGIRAKRYHQNVQQFAEAVLSRAVLVVEGPTELVVFRAAADVLEVDPLATYDHPDLAGLALFDAGNDVSVQDFAAVFRAMNKTVFAVHDTPKQPFAPDPTKIAELASYTVIPYTGIEELLVTETPLSVQRRFLAAVIGRPDYPSHCGLLPATAADDAVRAQVRALLGATKGTGSYGALLLAECSNAHDLPPTITVVLLEVHAHLGATTNPVPHPHPDVQPGAAQPSASQFGEQPEAQGDEA